MSRFFTGFVAQEAFTLTVLPVLGQHVPLERLHQLDGASKRSLYLRAVLVAHLSHYLRLDDIKLKFVAGVDIVHEKLLFTFLRALHQVEEHLVGLIELRVQELHLGVCV